MTDPSPTPLPFGDEPIDSEYEDLLGRAQLASVLAEELAALDARRGVEWGIVGPWGSGKTSLANMALGRLQEEAAISGIVRFNPWLFSGVEDLATSLLSELALQLRSRRPPGSKARGVAAEVNDKIADYSEPS